MSLIFWNVDMIYGQWLKTQEDRDRLRDRFIMQPCQQKCQSKKTQDFRSHTIQIDYSILKRNHILPQII